MTHELHDGDMFMHDGSSCYHFENGTTFLRPKKFKLDWFGYSPDLNTIENL